MLHLPVQTDGSGESKVSSPVWEVVVAGRVRVRDIPSLEGAELEMMLTGTQFEVLETLQEGGTEWVRHAKGWSLSRMPDGKVLLAPAIEIAMPAPPESACDSNPVIAMPVKTCADMPEDDEKQELPLMVIHLPDMDLKEQLEAADEALAQAQARLAASGHKKLLERQTAYEQRVENARKEVAAAQHKVDLLRMELQRTFHAQPPPPLFCEPEPPPECGGTSPEPNDTASPESKTEVVEYVAEPPPPLPPRPTILNKLRHALEQKRSSRVAQQPPKSTKGEDSNEQQLAEVLALMGLDLKDLAAAEDSTLNELFVEYAITGKRKLLVQLAVKRARQSQDAPPAYFDEPPPPP